MVENPQVDVAVRNEGEVTVAELLAHIATYGDNGWLQGLEQVHGISYFPEGRGGDFIRTEERTRLTDLDILPSPYLLGVFDNYPQSCKKGAISSRLIVAALIAVPFAIGAV